MPDNQTYSKRIGTGETPLVQAKEPPDSASPAAAPIEVLFSHQSVDPFMIETLPLPPQFVGNARAAVIASVGFKYVPDLFYQHSILLSADALFATHPVVITATRHTQ
jgi:hypothetical protein